MYLSVFIYLFVCLFIYFFALACSSLACTVQRVSQMVLFPHLAYYQSQCEELARSLPPTIEAVRARELCTDQQKPHDHYHDEINARKRHLFQVSLCD